MRNYYSALRIRAAGMFCRRQIALLSLVFALILFPAGVFAQKLITLNIRPTSLYEALKQIDKQTEYSVLFRTEYVKNIENVTVKVKNGTINDVMRQCLSGTSLQYTVEDYTVVISPKKTKSEVVSAKKEEAVNVTGKIIGTASEPLIGVSVTIKGTTTGTSTDSQGNFTIPIRSGQVLVCSFVGMKTQEITYKPGMVLKVVMENTQTELDEVVITGYYVANKKSYTGSTTQITRQEIQNISTTNIFTVLQALDPSFKIVENNEQGSNPNAIPEFQLRGSSSITALKSQFDGDPNMPLFMVDGFEMGVEKVFDLDPLRIESITVLKDASATAIYGSRASNGIIVIELVRPEKGRIKIDYDLKYILNVPDLTSYDLLDAERKFILEERANVIKPYTETYNEKLANVRKGYNTDWLNKPLRVGQDVSHSVTASGGDDRITYSVNLNYSPNNGVMKGSDRKRYALASRLSYRFKNINISNSLSYDYVVSNDSPYGSYSQYGRLNPYYRITDDNGKPLYMLETTNVVYNPLWNVDKEEIQRKTYNLLTENLDVKWHITPALQVSLSGAVNIRNGEDEQFFSAQHTQFGMETDMQKRGIYSVSNSKSVNYQGTFLVAYSQSFQQNFITCNMGLNFADSDDRTHGFSVEGFVSPVLSDPSFGVGYSKNKAPMGYSNRNRNAGSFLNLNYSYNNIYFADFSFRADISSRFGKDSRWAPFWSVGMGYNIHNEKFMQDVTFINTLKLRFSYGLTGSQNYDPYQAMRKYDYTTSDFYNGNMVGAILKGIGNDKLKWQRTFQTNVGIDFSAWENRLTATVNYYRKKSSDLLVPVTLAPSLGFTSYMENLGEVSNSGFDLSLRGVIVRTKDFSLSISANGTRNKNKLLKISNALTAWNNQVDNDTAKKDTRPKIRFIEGQSMNTIWVVKSEGIDPANGREMFRDSEGKITYTWRSQDQIPFATTDPKLSGSLGANLFWKGISLSAYMRYSLGGMKYNHTLVSRVENADLQFNCDSRVFTERWQKEGDRTFFKRYNGGITNPTSRFVQKDNYLTMTSINLSYQLPAHMLEKTKVIKMLRVGFNTNELFYLSTIRNERGLDYPFARTFNFSLQTSF